MQRRTLVFACAHLTDERLFAAQASALDTTAVADHSARRDGRLADIRGEQPPAVRYDMRTALRAAKVDPSQAPVGPRRGTPADDPRPRPEETDATGTTTPGTPGPGSIAPGTTTDAENS